MNGVKSYKHQSYTLDENQEKSLIFKTSIDRLNKQTLNFHAKNNNFGAIFRMFKWDILGNFSPTVTKYIKVALGTSRDFLDFLKA